MIRKSAAVLPVLLAAGLLVGGCTPSVVYSPSINLPPEPMKQKGVQVMGGLVEMPEVRPQAAPKETVRGAEFTIRFGAFDWMTLQGKFWEDLSDNFDIKRGGISVSTILSDTRNLNGFRLGLMPTAVFLGDERNWLGGGGTLPLCIWFPDWGVLHPYGAIGPGFGVHDLGKVDDQWGWLMIENCGLTVLLFDHLTINAELSAVQAHNHYDKRDDSFMVWSINGGLLF